jgi:hypothetical protein
LHDHVVGKLKKSKKVKAIMIPKIKDINICLNQRKAEEIELE